MRRSHRHLPVILNEDVDGLGFTGSLVEVRTGYARNFLLPKQLAAVATPELQKERAKQVAAAELRRETEVAEREELAKGLTEPIELTLKVGSGGQVFGSVTAAEFAKQVKAQRKLEVDPKKLTGFPLAAIGPAQVSAKLGLGVTAQIPVVVKGDKATQVVKPEATPDSDKEPNAA